MLDLQMPSLPAHEAPQAPHAYHTWICYTRTANSVADAAGNGYHLMDLYTQKLAHTLLATSPVMKGTSVKHNKHFVWWVRNAHVLSGDA